MGSNRPELEILQIRIPVTRKLQINENAMHAYKV